MVRALNLTFNGARGAKGHVEWLVPTMFLLEGIKSPPIMSQITSSLSDIHCLTVRMFNHKSHIITDNEEWVGDPITLVLIPSISQARLVKLTIDWDIQIASQVSAAQQLLLSHPISSSLRELAVVEPRRRMSEVVAAIMPVVEDGDALRELHTLPYDHKCQSSARKRQ